MLITLVEVREVDVIIRIVEDSTDLLLEICIFSACESFDDFRFGHRSMGVLLVSILMRCIVDSLDNYHHVWVYTAHLG